MPKLNPIENNNDELDLLFTLSGRDMVKTYTLCTENVCRILRHYNGFKDRFRYDSFTNRLEARDDDTLPWRWYEDNDAIRVQNGVANRFSFFQRLSKQMATDAIMVVSSENAYDSGISFLKSLEWDGTDRIGTWLCNAYGVEDTEYHRSVGSNWMKGLARRILEPGSKFDYVLVLEGRQGAKKSSSLGALGGSWHMETTMSTDTKDFFMQFQGKAVVEFSEGETLSRTEVKKLKAIITTQVDSFRPPYERTTRDFPRRCVFAMTTNETEYLKDDSGNRRWLPVRVVRDEADVEWIRNNREQLFAEAVHRVSVLNETVWEFPREATEFEQAERRVQSPNADLVAQWYAGLDSHRRSQGVTIHEAYRDVWGLGFSTSPMTKFQEMDIGGILKDTLGLVKRRVMEGGFRTVKWYEERTSSPYAPAVGQKQAAEFDDPLDF